jgi:hypothetical protein
MNCAGAHGFFGEGCMTRRSQPNWTPTPPLPGRRGPGRSWDPFYQLEKAARDDGKPYQSPEPKTERALLTLLGSNSVMVVMSCVLVVVVVALLALLVFKF